jgi:hypothetical protein
MSRNKKNRKQGKGRMKAPDTFGPGARRAASRTARPEEPANVTRKPARIITGAKLPDGKAYEAADG